MMDIEKEFDIHFDDDFLPVVTVGELCNEVIRVLAIKGEQTSDIQRKEIVARVCHIIGETVGIEPASIKEDDRIVEDLGAT